MRWIEKLRPHDRTRWILIDRARCTGCGTCAGACRRGAMGLTPLRFHRHAHVDDAAACVGCGACARVCPAKAIGLRAGQQLRRPAAC